jgi:plasmid stabilization system protein ParE
MEILEAGAYYGDRSADAARRFASDIEALIGMLRQFPRVLLSNFPYQFIYRIEGDEIRVYAVAHLKRKPRYWMGRL